MSRQTRVLPRSVTATITPHSFEGRRKGSFWRYVAQRRPLPRGFVKGLSRP